MNIPTGLYYRAKCIRTLKTIWDKKSTKDYIIDSCRRSSGNIKPIVVINETTKTVNDENIDETEGETTDF